MDETMDTEAFLSDFLTEAEEHLGVIDALLLQAEQSNNALPTDRIHELFRSVHTLKGMAGMMGFARFAALAHRMEQPLEELRTGARAFEESDWQSLGDCFQGLRRLYLNLAGSGREADPSDVADESASAALPQQSHSIRVDTARLDQLLEIVGELVVHITRLHRISSELSELSGSVGAWEGKRQDAGIIATQLSEVMQAVKRVSDDLQESTMRVRMLPVASLFGRFPRIVRDVAEICGKQARLTIAGGETELDKTVIEQIGDPLLHLIRNAIDHGLEPPEERARLKKPPLGRIALEACQQGPSIVISLSDDGRGLDRARILAKARGLGWFTEDATPSEQELFAVIFRPGFSTAEKVTSVSGRGVGMDVVYQNILRLGGSIQIQSTPGEGTRFSIKLPLTLVSAKALLARAGDRILAIPLSSVAETLRLSEAERKLVHGSEVLSVRDQLWPIMRLDRWFGSERAPESSVGRPAVVISDGDRHLALLVDELLGQQDVVMKSLGDFLGAMPGISGATILGDGRVALILDAAGLLAEVRAQVAV
ncbi:MAG TPA: chemotaxis protein CheA [Oscillatoriaceae cyanobacterium]